MAIKTFKPTTPSRRHMTVSAFEGIDKKAKPERSLVESQKKHAGRNSYGRITRRDVIEQAIEYLQKLLANTERDEPSGYGYRINVEIFKKGKPRF